MVDDKNIEEMVIKEMERNGAFFKCQIEDDNTPYYNQDDVVVYVQNAINWFLNNLWHPASEEPKFDKGRLLVLINGSFSILNVGFVLDQLRNLHNIYGIEGWLYLDDLLPKKGGEQ